MKLSKNEFGVPQYPPGDARRLFVLLAAIDLLEHPTAAAISDLTDLDLAKMDDDIKILQEQFDIHIHKIGTVYRLESWGNILNKSGVQQCLKSL